MTALVYEKYLNAYKTSSQITSQQLYLSGHFPNETELASWICVSRSLPQFHSPTGISGIGFMSQMPHLSHNQQCQSLKGLKETKHRHQPLKITHYTFLLPNTGLPREEMLLLYAGSQMLENTALDRRQTDHISLIHDLDLQSPASYGHDLLTCKTSRSMVSWF